MELSDEQAEALSGSLKALAAEAGGRSWRWRDLTFDGGQDGGALRGTVHVSDGTADVSMADGVREFIGAANPQAVQALVLWAEELRRRAMAAEELANCAVDSLRKLSDMYQHAWDTDNGNLVMLAESIPRFEAAHGKAQAFLLDFDAQKKK
ncbi:hypothetical protein [Achromobacter xylosoxidans]|uniref:hypothetical protein n=1 Tax=Alcaligenes xylosoxydans xylosoxydans TaxID=85698 RepID=UPI0013AF8082|nr:hypothetical protein [Achromobacter xylosoxidans]